MGVSKYFNKCFFVSCRTSYSDHMENIDGYLMKYTNLVTGWQYRCSFINSLLKFQSETWQGSHKELNICVLFVKFIILFQFNLSNALLTCSMEVC